MKDLLHLFRVLHGRLHEWRLNILPLLCERLFHPKSVYLVFTPEHDNLGDHAIAQSEKTWLDLLGISYIEITGLTLEKWNRHHCLDIMNGRTILIHGGGYLGSIWPESEALLRKIIAENPKSNILLLPNTIYYEKDAESQRDMVESTRIYNSHKYLKLYARERLSYEIMKDLYRNVALAPDMVLRMNKCKSGVKRDGCILCLRSDREKTRSKQEEASVIAQVSQLFGRNVSQLDMIASNWIPIPDRNVALDKQFDAFRHAKLVITDRLHGMIFCAITGTPCIVINSKSPKVLGCYEWVEELPYIQYCDDVKNLSLIYQSIPKREWEYDPNSLLKLYEPLKYDILCAARGKRYANNHCYRSSL